MIIDLLLNVSYIIFVVHLNLAYLLLPLMIFNYMDLVTIIRSNIDDEKFIDDYVIYFAYNLIS